MCTASRSSGGSSLLGTAPLSRQPMAGEDAPLFVPTGANPARPFGIDARKRACRLAISAGFECANAADARRPAILANLDFAWDPAWLMAMRERPRTALTWGGETVMAHVPAGEDPASLEDFEKLDAETAELSYAELRKRERPFVMRLDPNDPEPVERAAYDAAYKGVTDVLT